MYAIHNLINSYLSTGKMELFKFSIVFVIVIIYCRAGADKPCAARGKKAVVCVCNATYCDTITRTPPEDNYFVAYTSSGLGLRFKKATDKLLDCQNITCPGVHIEIDPTTKYQFVEGFGGAVTDAAGINWKNLSEPLQKLLVDSYFSDEGLQYNMIRTPIGGCDFSTHPYAYNDLPVNDTKLSNFTLTKEDYQYKIPLIKAAQRASSTPIHVVAATWSPPTWMKTNNDYAGASRLKPEYYETYADYHYKFIEKYDAEGIRVWALSTGNEPTDGVVPMNWFNSLGWTAKTMGDWIAYDLGPKIKNSTYKDVKILAADDQRLTLPYWVTKMFQDQPKAIPYIDGVAVHFYTDFIVPASLLTSVMAPYPQKFLLATEACRGSNPWDHPKVAIGSWQRAYDYIADIITDLNHNVVGWIDWNLCLNEEGGPNWAGNNVDAPIIVYPERNEFIKQPMFYAMGHFSKFIPRGSQRVRTIEKKPILSSTIENVAFVTPNKTVVVVFYNSGVARLVNIKLGNKVAAVKSYGKSVTTVELPYDSEE